MVLEKTRQMDYARDIRITISGIRLYIKDRNEIFRMAIVLNSHGIQSLSRTSPIYLKFNVGSKGEDS